MGQDNGSGTSNGRDAENDRLFGPRVAIERSPQATSFSEHSTTTSRRLADIQERVQEWDWRDPSTPSRRHDPSKTMEEPPAQGTSPTRASAVGGLPRRWLIIVAAVVVLGGAVGAVFALTGSNPAPVAPGHSSEAVEFYAASRTAAQAGLGLANGFGALKGVPTVTAVSAFTDPYAASLRRYLVQLDKITFTPAEEHAAALLKSQVRSFVQFLPTIHSIAPQALGSWIQELYSDVAGMAGATSTMRHELGLPLTPSI